MLWAGLFLTNLFLLAHGFALPIHPFGWLGDVSISGISVETVVCERIHEMFFVDEYKKRLGIQLQLQRFFSTPENNHHHRPL